MSHKIALDPLDFVPVRSVIGRERKRHMTIKLLSTRSEPAVNSLPLFLSSPSSDPNDERSSTFVHVVVQIALKIELPMNDTDRFQSSVVIAVNRPPA